jgi:hypothetical protein
MANPFRRKDSGSGIPANFATDDEITRLMEQKPQRQIESDFPQARIVEYGQEAGSRDVDDSGSEDIDSPVATEKSRHSINQEHTPRSNLSNNDGSKEEYEPSGVPRNPFAKTLATLEGRHPVPEIAPEVQISGQSRDKKRASRVLDVNSFKNLLLTGNSTSMVPDSASKWKGANQSESTSSTETSSISRQSLIENVAESSGETPRSSYDRPWPDESLKSKMDKHKPPPPPKSRHGKSLLPKGPQIVSFDDFSPTIPSESTPRIPSISEQVPASPTASLTTKPLPPTPPALTRQTSQAQVPELKGDGNEQATAVSQKKTAPPPPLTRRSTITKRPRGNTSSSITSVTEEAPSSYPPSIADSTNSQKIVPPPPPTRRSGSSNNILSPLSSHDSAKDRSPDPKSPPIPNRTRSSSQASLMSPPPLPPARRRSSRTSIELAPKVSGSASQSRRSSSEVVRSSFDSQRRISSGQQDQPIFEEVDHDVPSKNLPQKAPSSSGKDILADMDAFAEELEQLRNQYEEN